MLSLDYTHQTTILLPVDMRTQERIDWIKLPTYSFEVNDKNLVKDYREFMFDAAHTNQTISLEHFLNYRLKPLTDIYITDGYWYPEVFLFIENEIFSYDTYLFDESEIEPIPNLYVFSEIESDEQQIDFVVNLQINDSALQTKIESYLDTYKPAGKMYSINIY